MKNRTKKWAMISITCANIVMLSVAHIHMARAAEDPELKKIMESIKASKQKLSEINANIQKREEERKVELRTMLENADYSPYKEGMLGYTADALDYTKSGAKMALTAAAGTKAGPIAWIGYGGLISMGALEAGTKYMLTGDKAALEKDLAIAAAEVGATALIPGIDSKVIQTGAYIAKDTVKGAI